MTDTGAYGSDPRTMPVLAAGAAYVRLTTRCNNNCRFCNVEKDADIDLRDALDALLRIPRNASEIVITGGEPTIHKDLIKFLGVARKTFSAPITLQTNALMCSYPEFAQKLERAGVDRLVVSCPSLEPATYETLTGGRFDLFRRGLVNLNSSRLHVTLNFPINALNFLELPAFAHTVANDFGAAMSIRFSTLIPCPNVRQHPELNILYSRVIEPLRQCVDILQQARVRFIISGMYGIPLCILGDLGRHSETHIHLNPNIHAEHGEEQFLKSPVCAGCMYDNICPGVWSDYADMFGLDELKARQYRAYKLPRLETGAGPEAAEKVRDHTAAMEAGLGIEGDFAVWSVTDRCNCKCAMCGAVPGKGSITDHLSMEDIETVCADLHTLGFKRLLFCGGEPTLVSAMPAIIRTAKQSGFSLSLNTNGLLLDRVFQDYLDAGLDRFVISVDSPDAAAHDRIRGMPGLHAKIAACAKRISGAAGPDALRLHTVIMRDNIHTLEGMVDFAAKARVGGLDFTIVFDARGADNSPYRPLRQDIEHFYATQLPAIREQAAVHGIQIHVNPVPLHAPQTPGGAFRPMDQIRGSDADEQLSNFAQGRYNAFFLNNAPCMSAFTNVTIEYNGDVYPCAQSTIITNRNIIGNLKHSPLSALWNSEAFRAFRLNAPRHDLCDRCFSYS